MTIDVIQLAKEANIDLELHMSIGREPVWIATQDELERFTALVVEECAKVCDDVSLQASADWKLRYELQDQGREMGAEDCAAAIRARKPA